MKKVRFFLSLLLTLAMTAMLFAPALAEPATEAPAAGDVPMVSGMQTLSQKFSPFYAESGYDVDVMTLTQIAVLTTDRMGGIIYNAIEGETVPYNGTDYFYNGPADVSVVFDKEANVTTYTMKLRDDLKFSDGVPLTADDLIFSLYVRLDPSYIGPSTLRSNDIIGAQNYLTQTTDEVFAKYNAMFDAIYKAGRDHEWSDADTWTKDQQDWYWANFEGIWTDDVQAIVDYVMDTYLDAYAEAMLGKTPDEITSEPGLQVAFGMVMWGFGELGEDGVFTSGDKSWTLADGDYPTISDYYEATYAVYEGDPAAYWEKENAGDVDSSDVAGTLRSAFIGEWGTKDEGAAGGIPNIAGIKKLDNYTVEVKTNGYSAPSVYQICGIEIAPMHYYGDAELYDYENNKFGFPYGDVSIVSAKTAHPVGAGPYKFIEYANKTVYYEANEYYMGGEPTTKYFQFKETLTSEVAPGIATATIDAGEITGNKDNFALISSYNENGEITGDTVTTKLVDNRGYGYIGINAKSVKVGEDPFSLESTYLRKAIATILAVYRDVAFDSFYGEAASVINYPISNTSWAAPQPTDEDYKVAFSVDKDGNDIYTSDMTSEQKYAKALEVAIDYFKAAGFTFDEATGLLTAAPEGAKLSYELIIPADGIGDHPSFALVTDASTALATIGFDLHINDPANSNVLWDSMNANTHELWCAAWQTTIDPDMHQTYHSTNVVGLPNSTTSNHYNITLPELDALIMEGRTSDDQAYRKAIYKQALDLIVNQAVEIPCYQRKNATAFSTLRIDCDTITPDMTTYWGWLADIQPIAMTANK